MSQDITRHAQILARLDELAAALTAYGEVLIDIVTQLQTLRALMNSPAALRDLALDIESDVWRNKHPLKERSTK